MSALATVPTGYHSVTPWLISRSSARMIDFLGTVFEATELGRVEFDGVIGHAEVRLGDSVVMLFDARPEWPPTPAYLRVYVDDDAAVLARAVGQGCTVVTEPTELAFGDRVSRIRDPWDNLWWIHERVAEVDAEELVRRAVLPEFSAAMERVQASELFPAQAAPPR